MDVTEWTDQQLHVSLKQFSQLKLCQRPLTGTCVCKYEYLIMHTVWQGTLLIIRISIQGLTQQRVLGWQGWEPLQRRARQGCYFGILHQKSKRRVCVCAHVCPKFINKGKERQRELLTFFPGGTRFWLVLRMCVRAFLMFFSFMLDSTAGGRNSDRPHSFLLKGDRCKVLPSVRPHLQNVRFFPQLLMDPNSNSSNL